MSGHVRRWLFLTVTGLMVAAGTAAPVQAETPDSGPVTILAEDVDGNDGTSPPEPNLAALPPGSQCYTSGRTNTSGDNWFYLQLNNRRNVHVLLATCVRTYNDNGSVVCASIRQGWWPGGDSGPLNYHRFDHFRVHVTLQLNDQTVASYTLTDNVFLTYINREHSRDWWNGPSLEWCVGGSPGAGSWTADGWVRWDKNDDGEGWLDTHQLHGSPAI